MPAGRGATGGMGGCEGESGKYEYGGEPDSLDDVDDDGQTSYSGGIIGMDCSTAQDWRALFRRAPLFRAQT